MRSRTSPIPGTMPALSDNPSTTPVPSMAPGTKSDGLRPDLWDSRYNKREIETLKMVAHQYGLDPLMREVIMLQGNIYVTAAGLQKLAQRDPDYNGCQIQPIVTDWETNFFVVKASVWKKGCDYPFEDFGDADSTTSTLQGRALFRHAITRARARAIRSAFAVPFCALEELDDEARWKATQGGANKKPQPEPAIPTASTATNVQQAPGMAHSMPNSVKLPRPYPNAKHTEATATASPKTDTATASEPTHLSVLTHEPTSLPNVSNDTTTLAMSVNETTELSKHSIESLVVESSSELPVESQTYVEKKASTHQQKMIQNYTQQLGWSEQALSDHLQTHHKVTVVPELTRRQASNVLDFMVEELRKNSTHTSIVVPTEPQKKQVTSRTTRPALLVIETEASEEPIASSDSVVKSATLSEEVPVPQSTEAVSADQAVLEESASAEANKVAVDELTVQDPQEVVETVVSAATQETPEVSVAAPEEKNQIRSRKNTATSKTPNTPKAPNQWTGDEQKRIGEDIVTRMQRANNLSDLRQEWQLFQGIRAHFSNTWIDQICETKDQRKAVLSAD